MRVPCATSCAMLLFAALLPLPDIVVGVAPEPERASAARTRDRGALV